MMAYNSLLLPRLSKCAAEWLDAHHYFNLTQPAFNEPPTIRILPPLASSPNAVRLRFEVNDADGLHQAQLFIPSTFTDPAGGMKLQGCQSLSGQSNTIEFITTELTAKSNEVNLQVIDSHGNWTSQTFPINIATLLQDSVVTITDANLAAAVRQTLAIAESDAITPVRNARINRARRRG